MAPTKPLITTSNANCRQLARSPSRISEKPLCECPSWPAVDGDDRVALVVMRNPDVFRDCGRAWRPRREAVEQSCRVPLRDWPTLGSPIRKPLIGSARSISVLAKQGHGFRGEHAVRTAAVGDDFLSLGDFTESAFELGDGDG